MFTKPTLMKVATMLAMAPLSTYGHMIMNLPKPYGNPNNSPLLGDGSDFPCKNVPYTVNEMNNWAVGSQQLLNFTGSATHGGGSCQISVTTDKEPTAASKFKVIYSIEGGCPAAVGGNLEGSEKVANFPFTVPSELPNGQHTVVWTWFNRIGNREMYANCGPITVTGGSDDTSAFDALPDMAVANIVVPGYASCSTPPGVDYAFEKPGAYKIAGGKEQLAPLCGGPPLSGNAPAPAPAPQQPPANPGIPTPAPAPALTSTLRTVFTITAPGNPAPSPGHDHADGEDCSHATSPAQPTQAPSDNVIPPPGSSNSDGTDTTCSPDGAVICRGETEFGLCNWGKVKFQPVAAGTTCRNGVIAKREYSHRNMRTVY